MGSDAWTSADPQPGDFDGDLPELDPGHVDRRDGDPDAALMILVSIQRADADLLRRLARQRGKTTAELIADLLRDADGCVT